MPDRGSARMLAGQCHLIGADSCRGNDIAADCSPQCAARMISTTGGAAKQFEQWSSGWHGIGLECDMSGSRTLGTAVNGRERSLAPFPGASRIGLKKRFEPNRWAFYIGTGVILATLLLPGSLLSYYGLYSMESGGNPLTKIHPATYLSFLAAWFALYGGKRNDGGMIRLFRDQPALAWAVTLMVFCIAYSVYCVGVSGVAVYVDTYLAAMLAAIALNVASNRQCRIVGYIMVTISVLDVLLAIYEVRVGDHLLPQGELDTIEQAMVTQYEAVSADATEFRGYAFWTHPLTGAFATALAVFMVLGMGMRWRRVVLLLGIFIIGLLAYGGRAALVGTGLMLAAAALFQLASGLATRRLNVGFFGAFIASVFVLPALFILLVSTTGVGDRFMTHLYLDDSAEIRLVQWGVLGHLNFNEALLGVPLDRVNKLKELIGLTGVGVDIENPWLLMFLGLGLVGFPFFVASLFLFLWHLGRRADTPVGWLIIMAMLLICSTSNSLGRKTPDLVIMTGFLVGVAGFRQLGEVDEVEARSTAIATHAPTVPRTALALAPQARVRGLSDRPKDRRGTFSDRPA